MDWSGVTVWETETLATAMQDYDPHCSPSYSMPTVTAWDPRWAGTEEGVGGPWASYLHSEEGHGCIAGADGVPRRLRHSDPAPQDNLNPVPVVSPQNI